MKRHLSYSHLVFVLALVATIIGFAAFSQEPEKSNSFRGQISRDNDTTASVKRNRTDDSRQLDQLDVELKHLDFEMKHLDEQMKHLDEEMKHLDFKTQKDLDIAMRKLDEKLDWKEINRQMNKSVARINKAQMAEVKRQIENAKVQMQKQKLNMQLRIPEIDTKNIRIETENAMANARKSIEKAKAEIQNMRDFTNALQSDGLIDKSKPYKIEVKEGELYINGTKQSKEVSEKYRHFYKKDNFMIDMNEERGTRI